MDKCTMCAGGPAPTFSEKEKRLYGQNRIAEGKVPLCAAMCSTNALIVGDAEHVADIIRERRMAHGHGVLDETPYGWDIAYPNE